MQMDIYIKHQGFRNALKGCRYSCRGQALHRYVQLPCNSQHQPELLLGEAGAGVGWVPQNAEKQFNWAFDFAHQQVRDLRLAQFQEVIENYDIDGLSLDFMRGPVYFRPGQAEKNLDKMTDLIRETQSLLQRKSESAGRKLVLLVRVPPYLEGCRQIGLDVSAWIKQSLVDIVVPASCRRENMNVQAGSFLELTNGRPCQMLAGLEHADHYGALTPEMYRAAAQRYWRAGVDGLYLFNMCCRGSNPPGALEYLILRDIADPERVARLDKHYIVARRWNDASHERIAEAADPPTLLPEELGPEPAELAVNVPLDDDFKKAVQDGVLQDVTVWVRFKDMFPTLDRLSFSWNGQQVADEQRDDKELTPGEIWVSLDVTGMKVNTGENELIIQLSKRAPDLAFGLTVYDVEATVRYRPRMKWGRSPRPSSWYRPRG